MRRLVAVEGRLSSRIRTLAEFIELYTERLRLRPLRAGDLDTIEALDRDPRVMAVFGVPFSLERSRAWLEKQLAHWDDYRFGRFHVSCDDDFVGLVGLSRTDFDTGIVPGVEIAWRLVFARWGRGYATEAAHAVLRDGFDRLNLDEIVGITTPLNVRSRRVMERLKMVHSPSETFEHPLVPEGPLRTHVVYRLLGSVSR